MDNEDQQESYREAYPSELSLAEREFIKISRAGRGQTEPAEVKQCTGVALSGGGIRSATFCLGVFQGLAALDMLKKIDFLSSVSGGGYFGSFYTRLFHRSGQNIDTVRSTLGSCPGLKGKGATEGKILGWLRENGRYLSPRGSGDLLLFGAVVLRNWMVVQVVMAIFFLLVFLTGQGLRGLTNEMLGYLAGSLMPDLQPAYRRGMELWQGLQLLTLPGNLKIWLSPLILLPKICFLFWAVPAGWGYWMVGRQPPRTQFYKHPLSGLVAAFLAALVLMVLCLMDLIPGGGAGVAAYGVVMVLCLLTAGWAFIANRRPVRIATKVKRNAVFQDEAARHWISSQLKVALLTTGATLAIAMVDSLGQTVYLGIFSPGGLMHWGAGLLAAAVALVPFANRIMIAFEGRKSRAPGNSNLKAALAKAAAALAAVLAAVLLLTAINVAANAIAYGGTRPPNAPVTLGYLSPEKLTDMKVLRDFTQPNQWRMFSDEDRYEPQTWPVMSGPQPDTGPCGGRQCVLLGAAWLFSLILSLLFGQFWPFLNRSTQQPLYSARLTRAYLGASNPNRLEPESSDGEQRGGAVTRVIPGDDIDPERYWPWPPAPVEKTALGQEVSKAAPRNPQEIYEKGTPLHLINVTINETIDGRSQVQQQDRKGIGLAFGPAGLSSGVYHHTVFTRDQATGPVKTVTYPRDEKAFRVFHYPEAGEGGAVFTGERLPLGQMVGISGAAFSTGIGSRTSLVFSLLSGLANIRLGYWWDSGVAPRDRKRREKPLLGQRWGERFTKWFPVQSYLLDEYTARFHGTARKHWYLSDGGHFENMGGYELIRRRLKLIAIIDAEADPDYKFGGLGNLIRKARIDFGAEIRFLSDDELAGILPESHQGLFRSLESLRRGRWVEEYVPGVGGAAKPRETIDPVDHTRHSLAHAALATVSYDGKCDPESCILYLKPSIVGDEPQDVLQYHVNNPAFPHETTADQFFDEAQWESYRTLGEHVARKVLIAPEGGEPLEWLADLVLKRGTK